MNNSLVYLACPYSHPDPMVRQQRFKIANLVTGNLLNAGYFVFSPISMSHPVAVDASLPGDWQFWAAFDKAMLARCQKVCVVVAEGFSESVGVTAELQIAKDLGLPIEYVYLDDSGRLVRSTKPFNPATDL